MRKIVAAVTVPFLLVTLPAEAHFNLAQPPSAVVQSQIGDPQKPGSLTDSCPAGKATGAVTQVHVGDPLHVKITETVGHGGHYRVAFAASASAFQFPETKVTSNQCISTTITDSPALPVLADGLFLHDQNQANAGKICNGSATCEADVTVPDVAPGKYVLQVIEWMTPHGSAANNGIYGCFYAHCADIEVLESESEVPDGGVVFQDAGAGGPSSGSSSGNGNDDGGGSGSSRSLSSSPTADSSCTVGLRGSTASFCVPLILAMGIVRALRRRQR